MNSTYANEQRQRFYNFQASCHSNKPDVALEELLALTWSGIYAWVHGWAAIAS